MVRENARQEVRRRWRELIRDFTDGEAKIRVNGEPSYICPFCGHGKGGDGITYNPKSVDQNSLKCFGCGWSGDIIDLCQTVTSTNYNEALSLLAGSLNISVDTYSPAASDFSSPVRKNDLTERRTIEDRGQGDINPHVDPKTAQRGSQSQTEGAADYTEYYRACRARIHDPIAVSYLEARGISVDTAEAYWIGYDPAADPATNPGSVNEASKHPCPRLIIPSTKGHYVGRSLDPNNKYQKVNAKGSTAGIFNKQAIYAQDVQELFVVEGVFDALSIIEAGSSAIALNSADNWALLIEAIEAKPTEATLILCLDKDDAGKAATENLKASLRRLNIGFITADICGEHKDPNEAFVADREAFVSAVTEAKSTTAAKPDNTSNYIDQLMGAEIDKFKDDIATGYANLDKLSGGLYGGLYCLGAISSLGKTTFAAQMADQIAARGNDVIFFSLEQSKLELVSKSIARKTAQKDMKTAVSNLSIRKGYLPPHVLHAAEEYKAEVGDRVSIIEGNFGCDVSFIGDYVRQYIRRTKTRPVVFIDYLQILQAMATGGRSSSTKETVDITITELKRLSREMNIPVIAISSLNRSNYLTPVDLESFKESGGIEYTCDVVWGLQLECMNSELFNSDQKTGIKKKREEIKKAKRDNPRKIELSCLKNRFGIANFECSFDYYPANDLFVERGEVRRQRNVNPDNMNWI